MAGRRPAAGPWPRGAARTAPLVPRRRAGVRGVEIDDESVLYDERDGRLHLLNWSASAVWWSIDGTATVDDLAADLAARFHAQPDAMRSDVVALLDVLGAEHLVVAAGSARTRGSEARGNDG
jgi:hypothetical protein